MAAQQTIYLVDFENTGIGGLYGAERLPEKSHVYVFSSQNSPKISTATLAALDLSKFTFHDVPPGEQSVDKHLVSFLGFLIGKHGASAKLTIVSKDKGYDNIRKFWRTTHKIEVGRQDSLEPTGVAKQASAKSPGKSVISWSAKEANKEAKSKSTVPSTVVPRPIAPTRPASTPQQRSSLNARVVKLLSQARYNNEKIIGPTASLVVKHHADAKAKEVIHRELVAMFQQKQGSEIYNKIKSLL